MSDWDFLHDMHNDGYSPEQIADAAAGGYNLDEIFDLAVLGYSLDEWQAIDDDELFSENAEASSELAEIFENLVGNAKAFYTLTNRYLQIWGELGELYAEIEYGIKRHKPHAEGSDGKLGNDFIEIKTISPEKNKEQIKVKSAGNFNKLLIVKITKDFTFERQLIARKDLLKGEGKYMTTSWSSNEN
jgi:hypothetical protein